jgi:voltage-gated potassium channel
MTMIAKIRKRTYEILQIAQEGDVTSRLFDLLMLTLIFLNVVAVIIGTVAGVQERFGDILDVFEIISVTIFTAEYFGRVWTCVEDARYTHPIKGRLRYLVSPMAIIDLLAILPFYLSFLMVDLRFLRAFRLFRVLRILKLTRYFESLQLFGRVVQSRKPELVVTIGFMVLMLIITGSVIYYVESLATPPTFPDIPHALWWSVITLTTVGYGDVYPTTALGKVVGGFVAVMGIGLVALPTAILGSGFLEELQKRHKKEEPCKTCPHCGKELPQDSED